MPAAYQDSVFLNVPFDSKYARLVHLEVDELTFGDYTNLVVGWLRKNPW